MERLTFTFTPTLRDLYVFTIGQSYSTVVSVLINSFFPAAAFLTIGLALHAGHRMTPYEWLGVILGIGFTPILVGIMAVISYRATPSFAQLWTYRFGADQIEISGQGFDSRIDWSVITRARETRSFMILFMGRHPVCWLPRRILQDPGTLAALRQLIRDKKSGAARLRSS